MKMNWLQVWVVKMFGPYQKCPGSVGHSLNGGKWKAVINAVSPDRVQEMEYVALASVQSDYHDN